MNIDGLVKVPKPVTPANAGANNILKLLDSGILWNDKKWYFSTFYEFVNIQKAVNMLGELGRSLQKRAEAVDCSKGDKTSVVFVLLPLSDVVEQLAETTKLVNTSIPIPGMSRKSMTIFIEK